MEKLIPDLIVESVLAVDREALKQRKITGLLVDIDNTLVPWGSWDLSEDFITWIEQVKAEGFKLCIVSNALEDRAQHFAQMLDIPAIGRAIKPTKRAFARGLQALGLAPHEVAVIGDQLFTDIFGGNRLELYTILVNPLSREELGSTRFMRKLEQRVLKKMVKRGLVPQESLQIREGRD